MRYFGQKRQLPRRGENRIAVVGDQLLTGDGRVHGVIEQQLGRVGCRAVGAVDWVAHTVAAAVAGADQVLAGGQAELRRAGQGFLEQHGYVQGNDLGVDASKLADQRLIEHAGQLRQWPLLWRAAETRGLAQVGQQPHHDVACACLLQRLGTGGQAGTRSGGGGRAGDQPLKEVVAATRQVVQGVRVRAQAVGQIAGAFTQHRASIGLPGWDDCFRGGGDRVEDLLRGVAAHRPVVTVWQAPQEVAERCGRTQ